MTGWAWFWLATTLLAFAGHWFLLVQWRRSIRDCEEALTLLRRASRRHLFVCPDPETGWINDLREQTR